MKFLLTVLFCLSVVLVVSSQVLIGDSAGQPDSNAVLEIRSSTKGFLPPRMTQSERNDIIDPVAGLIIYCSDCKELQLYNDTAWTNIVGMPTQPAIFSCGNDFDYEGQVISTVLLGD